MGALDGLKVVDLSRLLPGPFCTTLLADHGADVLVVEAPRFRHDPVVGLIPMVQRNKRHMALDLKQEAGRKIFFEIVADADVLLEGFRPGVAERLGIGYEAIRGVNSRIIFCSLTGYGQDGPLTEKAGHDINYMATAGMFDLMRDLTGNPIVPNLQIADLTGSLYAALGILLALTSREKTGQGQHVDVAMTEGLVSLLALGLSFAYSGVTFPGRPDNNNPSQWFACYRLYETADGEYFSIGALEPHLWASVCRTLGCPEYAALQYDRSSQARIIAHLEKLFRSKTRAQWNEILSEPDNCVAPVMHVPELIDDPYLKFRKLIHQPQGGVPEPGIVPKLSLTPGDLRLPAYHFGQHTRQVLKELGYSGAEMEDLEDREVIWTAPTSCA